VTFEASDWREPTDVRAPGTVFEPVGREGPAVAWFGDFLGGMLCGCSSVCECCI
jgi:hypothetical protein